MHLGVEAEHGGQAQEGVLLLHVVPDAAQRGAPDADKVLQVRRNGLRAHPGHASQRDRTAIRLPCSAAAMQQGIRCLKQAARDSMFGSCCPATQAGV